MQLNDYEFKSITDKLLNNTDENKQFMQLGDFHTENKKWVSTLIFDTEDGKLRLQLPPCSTKAGIIDMTNKTYTDLLFDNSTDEIKELVNLFLTLENIAAKELHSKSDSLFEEGAKNMTLDDFEEMFTSTFRLLNRQTNVCVRVNIPTNSKSIKQSNSSFSKCDVYNKKGETRDISDIKKNTKILPLVEISDIHITSTSINLYLNMTECMILNDETPKINSGNRRIQFGLLSETTEPIAEPIADNTTKPIDTNIEINISEKSDDYVKQVEDNKESVELKPFIEPEDENTNDSSNVIEPVSDTNIVTHEDDINEETLAETKEITTVNDVNDVNQIVSDNLEEFEISLNENDNDENDGDDDDGDGDNIDKTNNQEQDKYGLLEINTFDLNENDSITLKKPDEVYKELYKNAITRAKKLRQVALEAYLDAKKIKAKFMLKDIYDSDDDGDEDEDEAEMEELTY